MDAPEKSTNSTNKVDVLGKFASGICAIHCALCAFLPGIFALIGLEILVGHEAEWGFTIVAITFALGAMLLGFKRHQSPRIALLFAVGIIGLLGSRFLEEMEGHEGHDESVEHAEKDNHGEEEKHAGEEGHTDEEGHDDHHGMGFGLALGLGSGALLVFSHFQNAAAMRSREEDCCDT